MANISTNDVSASFLRQCQQRELFSLELVVKTSITFSYWFTLCDCHAGSMYDYSLHIAMSLYKDMYKPDYTSVKKIIYYIFICFICFNKADRSHVHCIKKIIKIQVRIHNMTISWHQCATRTFVFIRTIKHHRSFGLYVFSQEGERVSLSFSSGTSNNANSPKSLQISQRRSQTTNHKPTATGK